MDKGKKQKGEKEALVEGQEGHATTTTAVRRGAMMLSRWVSRKNLRTSNDTGDGEGEGAGGASENDRSRRRNTLATLLSHSSEVVIDRSELEGATEKEGFLYREGENWKTWKEKWFILKDAKLYYKKSMKSEFLQGRLELSGAKLAIEERYTNTKFERQEGRKHYFFAEESVITLHWYEAMLRSAARIQREERRRARRAAREAASGQTEEPVVKLSISAPNTSTTVRSSKSEEADGDKAEESATEKHSAEKQEVGKSKKQEEENKKNAGKAETAKQGKQKGESKKKKKTKKTKNEA